MLRQKRKKKRNCKEKIGKPKIVKRTTLVLTSTLRISKCLLETNNQMNSKLLKNLKQFRKCKLKLNRRKKSQRKRRTKLKKCKNNRRRIIYNRS